MLINGYKFYDMQTHEAVEIEVPDIDAVIVQPADITTIDAETMEIVGDTTIYCVIIAANSNWYSTQPLDDEILAHRIGQIIASKCWEHIQKSN